MKQNQHEQGTINEKELEKIKEEYWEKYLQVAKDVVANKYGSYPDRKNKLIELGYDYDLVQAIVTALV